MSVPRSLFRAALSASRKTRSRSTAGNLRVEALEGRTLLSASLVRNINPGAADSNPSRLVQVNDTLYFLADDGRGQGTNLWRSDGTAAGTYEVFNIPDTPTSLAYANGEIFFSASQQAVMGRRYLFKHDVTTGVTTQLVFLPTHSGGLGAVFAAGDRIYYFMTYASPGARSTLMTTDGTPGGSVALMTGFAPNIFSNFTHVNGTLFFSYGVTDYMELYKSDGTPGGTRIVKDINPNGGSNPSSLANVGGLLYFSADDGTHGRELWVSDGTFDGTVMSEDIVPGPAGSDPRNIIAGERTYALFSAETPAHGRELWVTPWVFGGGAHLIKDIVPGPGSSNPENLTDVSGYTFFTAETPEHGRELWFSDWLEEGTYLLKDINPGPGSSNPRNLTSLYGYFVYFTADVPGSGRELYVSDWTPDGTVLDTDILLGGSSNPDSLVEMSDGYLYFAATGPGVGRELYRASYGAGPGGAPGGGGAGEIAFGLSRKKDRVDRLFGQAFSQLGLPDW